MKRTEFNDYFNNNYLEVSANSKKSYVSLCSQDLENGESVQINLSIENTRKLIDYLSTVVR